MKLEGCLFSWGNKDIAVPARTSAGHAGLRRDTRQAIANLLEIGRGCVGKKGSINNSEHLIDEFGAMQNSVAIVVVCACELGRKDDFSDFLCD